MPNKSETPANVEDVGQPKREASLAAPNGYAAGIVEARRRISEARAQWLKQQPQPGMSDDDLDKWNMMMLAYGNGMAAARSLLGRMLDETRKPHTAGTER